MLSGQLAPSSANWDPNPKYLIDDESTTNENYFKCEKFNSTTTSAIPTTVYPPTTSPTPTSGATETTTTLPTISVPGTIGGTFGNYKETTFLTTTLPAASNQGSSAPGTNSATDASGRSAALERAYVHDVYENCEEPVGPIRPRVAQFLAGLDPGSIVCDVGCGNGRYLTSCNPLICTIGVDRCYRLTKAAQEKGGEVALCDNLELPFRDESFDAVLSLAVVHHFATTERRVGAIRELARILRIGGRVVISVWALEQRHRRFESQDVLIPWQPPRTRNQNFSDEEDDDDYLPPYHAYTEDSTNSSRSAGDGDSSSLSSSSPGESCYSFVRRAIQKLAGGRKHPWFLDSWNSKDTKNDSSLEYEDAKDLPIELRRLEDFEDFPEPPLSAGLKSRSLGSILNPPPRQIVRSRSSVPSLGAQIPEPKPPPLSSSQQSQTTYIMASSPSHNNGNSLAASALSTVLVHQEGSLSLSTTLTTATTTSSTFSMGNGSSSNLASVSGSGRRPKLVKQKQSLCDEEGQLPTQVHLSGTNSSSNSVNTTRLNHGSHSNRTTTHIPNDAKILLRKQSSLNEEILAENRLREKEKVRKRIQKQMSLNEAFLCRSLFTKRLQVIREGFTTKLKTSTGSLERVTKNGIVKIMQNFKSGQFSSQQSTKDFSNPNYQQNQQQSNSNTGTGGGGQTNSVASSMSNSGASSNNLNNNCYSNTNNNSSNSNNGSEDQKPRRHSRESGSDSSKDSSLQSDTSIESEDSFASVIYIPRPEQNKIQQNSVYSCNNISNKNNNTNNHCNISNYKNNNNKTQKIPSVPTSPLIMPCPTPAHSPAASTATTSVHQSVTTMFASPTPPTTATSTTSSCTAAMAASLGQSSHNTSLTSCTLQGSSKILTNRFTFEEDHIIQQQQQQQQQQQLQLQQQQQQQTQLQQHQQQQQQTQLQQHQQQQQTQLPLKSSHIQAQLQSQVLQKKPISMQSPQSSITSRTSPILPKSQKITRQIIKDLPQIPKFRKQQSLQQQSTKAAFPIVRRASAAPAVPKLMSLEIFNPETDDLDSDSSEPSSPDSVDSVISALKPGILEEETNQPQLIGNQQHTSTQMQGDMCASSTQGSTTTIENSSLPNNAAVSTTTSSTATTTTTTHYINDDSLTDLVLCDNDSKLNDFSDKLLYNNKDNLQITKPMLSTLLPLQSTAGNTGRIGEDCNDINCRQHLVDFAEKLSAQLLKELDENNKKLDRESSIGESESSCCSKCNHNNCNNCSNTNGCSSKNGGQNIDDPYLKRLNGELRDLTVLREELRERRLMLANLSTSSTSSSSSLASQNTISGGTKTSTIHEEDESPGRRNFKSNHYSNYFGSRDRSHLHMIPDTAYLMQDYVDSSFEDDDEDYAEGDDCDGDIDEIEHDVILEEDEEYQDEEEYEQIAAKRTSNNTISCIQRNSTISSSPPPLLLDSSHPGTESWGHSNSTTSLDSPSQGGATTHHRYYHVFREGELDALINHHVASLHIVSSYYERASWCVVAEKVQVWTI